MMKGPEPDSRPAPSSPHLPLFVSKGKQRETSFKMLAVLGLVSGTEAGIPAQEKI